MNHKRKQAPPMVNWHSSYLICNRFSPLATGHSRFPTDFSCPIPIKYTEYYQKFS